MKKYYEVPAEVRFIMTEALACEKLRDLLIKLPFGFKKARGCAVESCRLRERFWEEIHALYPELHRKHLLYMRYEREVVIDEKGDK